MKYLAVAVLLSLAVFSACQNNQGTLESAGEKADEMVDNVKEGEAPLKERGAAEKAGEAIDESVDDAADAVEDAADDIEDR